MARQRRVHRRWEGVVGISDRVAFKMPGDEFITAGTIEEMDEHTVLLSNIACVPEGVRSQVTMVIQQKLIIENKSELARQQARQRRKERHNEPVRTGKTTNVPSRGQPTQGVKDTDPQPSGEGSGGPSEED